MMEGIKLKFTWLQHNHNTLGSNFVERSSGACSEQREVDVSYVLFLRFSYMLQKPQGNHTGIKSHIYQELRMISVMYFCTISSLFSIHNRHFADERSNQDEASTSTQRRASKATSQDDSHHSSLSTKSSCNRIFILCWTQSVWDSVSQSRWFW